LVGRVWVMPEECFVCGTQPDVPRECDYCSKPVCSEHLLPENHDCTRLRSPQNEKWFPDEFDKIEDPPKSDAEVATDHNSRNGRRNTARNSYQKRSRKSKTNASDRGPDKYTSSEKSTRQRIQHILTHHLSRLWKLVSGIFD
jgi:hypothetical protein